MNTIQEQWQGFKEAAIPSNDSEFQLSEIKKAFYAGAYSLLAILLNISDRDVSENAAAHILENLRLEALEFFQGEFNDD